jgi:hypothetical protein
LFALVGNHRWSGLRRPHGAFSQAYAGAEDSNEIGNTATATNGGEAVAGLGVGDSNSATSTGPNSYAGAGDTGSGESGFTANAGANQFVDNS